MDIQYIVDVIKDRNPELWILASRAVSKDIEFYSTMYNWAMVIGMLAVFAIIVNTLIFVYKKALSDVDEVMGFQSNQFLIVSGVVIAVLSFGIAYDASVNVSMLTNDFDLYVLKEMVDIILGIGESR